jgi:hypothetical protein
MPTPKKKNPKNDNKQELKTNSGETELLKAHWRRGRSKELISLQTFSKQRLERQKG